MSCLRETIKEIFPESQPLLNELDKAETLTLLVTVAWQIAHLIGVRLVEEVLAQRTQARTEWPVCEKCGCKMQSKGWVKREIKSIMGRIQWRRRIGRCPRGCAVGQVAPFDSRLGIAPNQKSEQGLQRLACLLVVFVPYGIAEKLIKTLLGTSVSRASLWNWVQEAGQRAQQRLEAELDELERGHRPAPEEISPTMAAQTLLMGADGVMAPFRPEPQTAKGRVQWREVKVGIFARLQQLTNRAGQVVPRLGQRRVVATLENQAQFAQQMVLEGHKQGVAQAQQVAWVSDGGRGLWRLYKTHFAPWVTPILDFYHASQNIWSAAANCFKGDSLKSWFAQARHSLRHGQAQELLFEIGQLAFKANIPEEKKLAWSKLYNYLDKHRNHIEYDLMKEMGFPIGSGFVESTCKWLIQQRFKGVGMRWSVDGFNNLLHLRTAWVNQRFDGLFPSCSPSPKS